MNVPLVAGGASVFVAGVLVPLLVRFAVGRNLLDVPNLRSSHEVPTPRLGGLAIMAGTWVGAALLQPEEAWPLLIAATLIGAVGLVDDLGDLHFGAKAVAQTVVAAGLLYVYPPPIISAAPEPLKIAAFAVGVFWIVALSNAFNFMDALDGLIGGVALLNAIFLVPLAGGAGVAVLPVLAGATAGFLIWNINPASIFLGDSGSYFIGFSLATAALYAALPAGGWTSLVLVFVSCVLVFTPLLLDTGYTLVRRLWAGKNVFLAHREHICQRITPTTAMHRRTSNLYYGVSLVAGFAASLVASGGALMLAGFAVALVCCGVLVALPRLVWTGTDTGG